MSNFEFNNAESCIGDEWKEVAPHAKSNPQEGYPIHPDDTDVFAFERRYSDSVVLRTSNNEWIESDTTVERSEWL